MDGERTCRVRDGKAFTNNESEIIGNDVLLVLITICESPLSLHHHVVPLILGALCLRIHVDSWEYPAFPAAAEQWKGDMSKIQCLASGELE